MRFLRPAVPVFLLLFFAGSAWAQVVDVTADWPKGVNLKKGSDPIIKRFKITGPGRLDVKLSLNPYRHANRTVCIPLVWGRYLPPTGKFSGWGVLGSAFQGGGYPDTFTQGGKEARNFIEGVPLNVTSRFDVARGEYDVAVQLAAPGWMDSSGITQWAQQARLVINFSPGNPSGQAAATTSTPASSKPATAVPGAAANKGILGTWVLQAGGYPGTLQITADASGGLAIRNLPPGAPAEVMTDVRFNAATGEIQFVRSLKAQGYPDQIFKGKLVGDTLSGTFGFAPNMGAPAGWSATRKK